MIEKKQSGLELFQEALDCAYGKGAEHDARESAYEEHVVCHGDLDTLLCGIPFDSSIWDEFGEWRCADSLLGGDTTPRQMLESILQQELEKAWHDGQRDKVEAEKFGRGVIERALRGASFEVDDDESLHDLACAFVQHCRTEGEDVVLALRDWETT